MKFYENLENQTLKTLTNISNFLGIKIKNANDRKEIIHKLASRNLESFNLVDLEIVSIALNIEIKKNKTLIIEEIKKYKYYISKQLGTEGKDGKTFLVFDKKGNKYAMKQFKFTKKSEDILKEIQLQSKASDINIAPKIIDFNLNSKYIVMQLMDSLLYDYMLENEGIIPENIQTQILNIYKKLDKIKIFHADANILNYMFLKDKIYIIDFGMSEYIDTHYCKQIKSNNPNSELMTLGMILKLKELNCDKKSYNIFIKNIKPQVRRKFNL